MALLAERERWILWLPVFFALGISLYFALAQEPALWIGAGISAVALALLWCWRSAAGPRLLALALTMACVGFASAQLRSAWVEAPQLERSWGPGQLTGEVLELETRPRGRRLLLRPLAMAGLAAEDLPARVRITAAATDAELRPGDVVTLRARLRPPSAPTMPGGFDFARQAYFQQLGGIGFALGPLRAADHAAPGAGAQTESMARRWGVFWAAARHRIAERITSHLPGQSGAVAAALVTGQRGALSEETREDMRAAGLAHLLAISGLHMGLVTGLLFFALRAGLALSPALALHWPIKKAAAVTAGLGGLLYLCLVGFTIPAQRAFIMVSIVLLAVLLDRRAISLRLVAWAALAVLLVAPESLVSASFQMSFAAVVALVSVYEGWERSPASLEMRRHVLGRLGLYILGVALTSLVAILATSAFAAFHFQRLAVFGLLANLVAVPLTAFVIMPAAVIGMLLMPLGLESLGFVPMGWGIDALLSIAGRVADLPGALVTVPPMPLWGLVCVTLGGLWLCLWRGRWRYWGLPLAIAGALSPALFQPPDLLVSGDGRLAALRDEEGGLWLADRRGSRFVIDSWRRGSDAQEVLRWPRAGTVAGGALSCDPLGCLYRKQGILLALSWDPRGLAEDCAVADVVVSLEPLRRQACGGPQRVIDRFDLWREGAQAIWVTDGRLSRRTVLDTQGLRPWSALTDRQPPGD
ncbi:ComEC/Rec2 family competence protein [Pelagibius sp.]|uniref:ComEC/Rec2 family competence protein n=1 Tax=Pelagibius sp. TaxID=1931238 RepID=UPI003B503B52